MPETSVRCRHLADRQSRTEMATQLTERPVRDARHGRENQRHVEDVGTDTHLDIVAEASLSGSAIEGIQRSEEHTSELQSLMRISYAVFCLKQKQKKNN